MWFRFMLDISVPVAALRFGDAVSVGARHQFRYVLYVRFVAAGPQAAYGRTPRVRTPGAVLVMSAEDGLTVRPKEH